MGVIPMDVARYIMALLLWVCILPALCSWFVVHPFVHVWRRLGTVITYTVVLLFAGLFATSLFCARDFLLVGDWGANLGLIVGAILTFLLSAWAGVLRQRVLSVKVMFGLPEISPERHPGKLLQEGIYARIRHPRYVEVAFGLLAWALFVNYGSVYGLTLLSWIVLYFVVLVEEKELRSRFGQAYEEYSARVPRFIPRFRSPSSHVEP